ncbi:hypothetical protein AB5N19_03721 [Seiridium cardinale]
MHLFALSVFNLLGGLFGSVVTANYLQGEAPLRQVFEFSDGTFIENLHVLPNGEILLSIMRSYDQGDLLILDPDAVIWTIAISPSKLKSPTWEQTCKISRDYAIKDIDVISHLPREEKTKPLLLQL